MRWLTSKNDWNDAKHGPQIPPAAQDKAEMASQVEVVNNLLVPSPTPPKTSYLLIVVASFSLGSGIYYVFAQHDVARSVVSFALSCVAGGSIALTLPTLGFRDQVRALQVEQQKQEALTVLAGREQWDAFVERVWGGACSKRQCSKLAEKIRTKKVCTWMAYVIGIAYGMCFPILGILFLEAGSSCWKLAFLYSSCIAVALLPVFPLRIVIQHMAHRECKYWTLIIRGPPLVVLGTSSMYHGGKLVTPPPASTVDSMCTFIARKQGVEGMLVVLRKTRCCPAYDEYADKMNNYEWHIFPVPALLENKVMEYLQTHSWYGLTDLEPPAFSPLYERYFWEQDIAFVGSHF